MWLSMYKNSKEFRDIPNRRSHVTQEKHQLPTSQVKNASLLKSSLTASFLSKKIVT